MGFSKESSPLNIRDPSLEINNPVSSGFGISTRLRASLGDTGLYIYLQISTQPSISKTSPILSLQLPTLPSQLSRTLTMLRSLLSFGRTGTNDFVFPKVDPKEDGPECLKDCADCTIQFPSKVKVETSGPLYGQIKEFHAHVLVATGQSDWKEKHVENMTGSLMEAFDGAKSDHGRMMVSASNLTPPEQQTTDENSNKATTVLILPSFTYIDSVTQTDVPDLISRYIDHPTEQQNENGTVSPTDGMSARPCELDYVILLCSHGRRDARCGITAPLIKRELERHLRPLGLDRDADDSRAGGVGIFFVSHVGGHKFSANVLVYRKKDQQMIWLARVRPEHCEGIVKYTVLQGKVVHAESQLRGGFDRVKGLTSW